MLRVVKLPAVGALAAPHPEVDLLLVRYTGLPALYIFVLVGAHNQYGGQMRPSRCSDSGSAGEPSVSFALQSGCALLTSRNNALVLQAAPAAAGAAAHRCGPGCGGRSAGGAAERRRRRRRGPQGRAGKHRWQEIMSPIKSNSVSLADGIVV